MGNPEPHKFKIRRSFFCHPSQKVLDKIIYTIIELEFINFVSYLLI